jgi:hypothetical protein
MSDVLGARILDRAPTAVAAVLRFVRSWGPFAAGDELALPPGDGTLATRSVTLAAAAGSEVVAVDGAGDPALVVASRGVGHAVTLSHPLELLLARTPDAHGPGDRTWGVYAGLAALAGIADPASVAHPDVTTGTLRGPAGGLAVVTNHGPKALRVPLRLPDEAIAATAIEPTGAAQLPRDEGAVEVALEPFGAAIIAWRTAAGAR